MTKMQDDVNSMTSSQLIEYHNHLADRCGVAKVRKFSSLEEGRETVYNLAWSLGLDQEAPPPAQEEETSPAQEPREVAPAPAPRKASARGKKPAPVKRPSVLPPEEIDPSLAREGTLKSRIVQLLLEDEGNPVALSFLAKKVYRDEASTGRVKLVLRGVARSAKATGAYSLVMASDAATLTRTQG